MTELPTGTVTMLFTDIEGSTRLLDRLGPAYAEVVSRHRAVLRAAFRRWGGQELGTEGDSFFVVFAAVGEALCAARDAQQDLARARWPDGVGVRVRMGLHTGEPVRHEDGYVGMDVHRAARVSGCAHGGQVVLTEATYRIAVERAVPGSGFTDLGLHRLKDLPQPEHLFQLRVEGTDQVFPRLRSLGSAAGLPSPTTSLVGRDREVGELLDLLASADVRLVTLTGTAGTGKTRLAIAVAAAVEGRSEHAVHFVPLAAARSEDVMWTSIADALGTDRDTRSTASLLEHLRGERLLLVLDNLEQLSAAPAVVRRVVEAAPGVRVLATSRRPLRLSAEHEYPVGPLPLHPTATGGGSSHGGGTAVELFERRARLVRPGFAVTEDNAEDVLEICRWLDGLPLAIELVAARVRLLGPRALRSRLADSRELASSVVDVPPRQQTLRSALDWSYELLPPRLQRVFRRLGVCDGDFDLAAAAAVLRGDGGHDPAPGPPGGDLLDDVGELVDMSLLTVQEGSDGEPRLRMLRTVAGYARTLLVEAAEQEPTARLHAEHYLAMVEEAADGLRGKEHLTARDRIERELSNLRAALAWSLGRGTDEALELGLRLCGGLSWFWYGCGYQAEGRRWLQAAVSAAGSRRSDAVMTALHGLGVLVLQQGESHRARDLLQLCVEHWRRSDDLATLSRELNSLAMAYRSLGEPGPATALVEEAVTAAERSGDTRREANAVSNLAVLLNDQGRFDEGIDLLRRSLALDTELHDAWGQGADHVNLVSTLLRAGRVDEADEHLRAHGHAAVALQDVDLTVDVVGLFAVVAARRGEAERAARLYGAVERMREQAELPLSPPDAAWFEADVAAVRGLPDEATWQRNVAVGAGLGVEEALTEAMACPPDTGPQ